MIKSSPSIVSVYRLVPVMLVLVMGISLACFRHFFEPVAYVSIDVNPSIELVLNRLGNVTAAEAYNNDGQLVLGKLTLTGLPLSDALAQIHACLRELEAPEEPGDKNCTAESGDRSCSEATGETHHGALRQQQQNGKNHHREHN